MKPCNIKMGERFFYTSFTLILFILFCGCIGGNLNQGTDFFYDGIEAYCDYSNVNITFDIIIQEFKSNSNITIKHIDHSNGITFNYRTNNLTSDQNNRMWSYLVFTSDSYITIEFSYSTDNPNNGVFRGEKEKEAIEKRIDNQYYIDKQILKQYIDSVTTFMKKQYKIEYDSINIEGTDFGEKFRYTE